MYSDYSFISFACLRCLCLFMCIFILYSVDIFSAYSSFPVGLPLFLPSSPASLNALIHIPCNIYSLLYILYCFSEIFSVEILSSSSDSRHPCLTPLHIFPVSEYSHSILIRIFSPMYKFRVNLLSLQSIPISLNASNHPVNSIKCSYS